MDTDTRIEEWMSVYADNLRRAITEAPALYAFGMDRVNDVCARMRDAFLNGTFNKNSHAIRWTCQRFGVKHTYIAIHNFIHRKTSATNT